MAMQNTVAPSITTMRDYTSFVMVYQGVVLIPTCRLKKFDCNCYLDATKSLDATATSMMTESGNQYWKGVFDKVDRNGDGIIELREFKQRSKSQPDDIPEDVRRKLFHKADVDSSGHLNFNEFVNLMESPDLPPTLRRRLHRMLTGYTRLVVAPRGLEDVADSDEYLKEYNCFPPPIFIILASIIEIAVFIGYAVNMGHVSASGPVPFDSVLIYDPYRRYEAWRYLSYMLIHAGFVHITVNIIVQLLLGIPLEMVHKWWRVGIVYTAGVIAGSLGTSISDPGVYLAGASGGVYALMTSHLSTIIMNWKEMKFAVVQLIAFLAMIGTDVGVAVYNRYSAGTKDRVGYAAHLAGAIAGLLVGIGILRNLRVRSWEKYLWWTSVVLFGILIVIAVIWNAAFPSYFPKSRYN